MAKQKPAPGKKAPKGKADRANTAKEAKSVRKRSTDQAKPAPKATLATKKKTSAAATPKQAETKQPVKAAEKKSPAKTAKAVAVKPTTKTVVAKATKQAVVAKAASKPTVAAKPPMAKVAKLAPAAKPVAQQPAPKREVAVKATPPATKREETVKPAKTAARAVAATKMAPKPAPAPRPTINAHVAGVLQAARSVASKATKVVEVEKERKSHLTPEELVEFRQILLDKRRELVDDMVNLEDEARRTGSEGNSGSSAMPIHMADLGSDTWEQEFTLNLIEKERGIVREIDEALDRIEKKTYGTCLATGKAISKARLRVKPWAKYCIEYARKRELGLT